MNFSDYIEINPTILLTKGKQYPFVEMANVGTNSREPIQIDYREFTSGTKFQDGDSVIARIEPCLQNGKKFFCHNIGTGFGSTEYLIFRPKNDKIDNVYLYYLLQTDYIRKKMIGSMTGATGRQRVNNDVFKTIEIEPPEINTQKKVGTILSAYDDLIENNQKQIKLLEEAAQQLYKEWFVDLRFSGYKTTPVVDGIPEGWELCRVGDVIEFNPKVPLSKERLKQSVPMSALSTTSMVLDADEFTTTFSNSGSKFQNGDTLLARITPCLENGKTAFVAGIENDEGAVGSTEFIVMRSKGSNPYMVYLFARDGNFRQSAINSMTGSDGRQRAQADKLKVLPYLKPTDQIMRLFARYVEPMFMQIQKKNEQNVRLRQARDRLLPKLMSGEIEVKSQRHKGVIP